VKAPLNRPRRLRPPAHDSAGPFKIEISQEDILEDLCWPNRPPGQWRVEPPQEPGTGHIDEPLEAIER
jgi:hypothetical protein